MRQPLLAYLRVSFCAGLEICGPLAVLRYAAAARIVLSGLLTITKCTTTLAKMENELYKEPCPLLTEEEQAELEKSGRTIRRPAGHTFCLEGEQSDFVMLIRSGHVKLTRGAPARILDVRGPGQIVGEMAVIRRKPRMASIIAMDDVEALCLPGDEWLRFLYDHPRAMLAQLAMKDDMAERASRKNAESELAVEQQLAKRVTELTAAGLGEPAADGAVILRLSQQDLAALIGARKLDSVKKAIGRLKASGIVGTGRQAITILQPALLHDIADGRRPAC